MINIRRFTADEARAVLPHIVTLLQDAVQDGASVGFVHPLPVDVADRYWQDVIQDLERASRILLVALDDGAVVGSVQLGLCTKPTGLHRAEVQKLLVHTKNRRRGIGRASIKAIETEARNAGRSLLYLDTEPDRPAAEMYARMGWTLVGEIPDYALTPDGQLHGTLIYYRKI